MSCEIIQFSTAAQAARTPTHQPAAAEVTATGARVLTPRQLRRAGKPEQPPPATETAKNARIRIERNDAWWLVERTAEYGRARDEGRDALATAQRWGIADGQSFPPAENESWSGQIAKWRETVAKQLITPAPTLAAVAWKRAKIKSDEFKRLPISPARAERAIADDLAFLAAHPTRKRRDAAPDG
jgi:hypothetical protein